MPLVLSFLGGYLLGSIPFGYLIVKYQTNQDIRSTGSGNVGGFNAFRVTNSLFVGWMVGLLDGAKGITTVWLATKFFGGEFWPMAIGLSGAVVGHMFPVWLRFKGGRGLATACGGLFLIGMIYTIVWCTIWIAAKARYKEILMANILATILAPIALLVFPPDWISALLVANSTPNEFLALIGILTCLFLISHRDGFQLFWQEGRAS
ncbi:MAG TPA: glycerol-3-phosphate acyltransferase [Bacteroidota bacterium]|nr:glycerol-3-phosphate acyltransferase [Bacteroidota bacterium]